MAHFSIKKHETPHAMTIDIVDEANNIQENTECCGTLNLTWIWDGVKDKTEEKERLLAEIQQDLLYVEATFGCEMAKAILDWLNQKIDVAYATTIH